MSNYENFGDVNYLDYNGIWIARDNDTCFNVVTLDKLPMENDEEFRYLVADGYIDLSDSWFDWENVYSSCGIDEDSSDTDKVIALNSYYGIHEFGGEPRKLKTLDTIEYLESQGIDVDKTSSEYKKEVLSEVFDIINDAVITLGTNVNFIDDEDEQKEAEKLLKELEDEEQNQEELCVRFDYELEDIKEYISEHYGIH